MSVTARRSTCLSGKIKVPGDGLASHISLILGSIASGETRICGLLENDAVLRTASAMQAMGAHMHKRDETWIIRGTGNGCLLQPRAPLDFANSKEGAYLVIGTVGTYHMETTFIGHPALSRHSVKKILDPLRLMGVAVDARPDNLFPLTLYGPQMANPIRYHVPKFSPLIKSAILLAALNTPGVTTLVEPSLSGKNVEKMFKTFGAELSIEWHKKGIWLIHLRGQQNLSGQIINLPGDPSFAAFLIIAALLVEGSDIIIENVLIDRSSMNFIQILWSMKADIVLLNKQNMGRDDVVDLRVRSSMLKGVVIQKEWALSMINEYPVLVVAAAFAEGKTTVLGIEQFSAKETDQLASLTRGLRSNRVDCEEGIDFLVIQGKNSKKDLGGGSIATPFNHQIAMCFLIFGLAAEKPVIIDNPGALFASYPKFITLMRKLGGHIF